LGPLAPPPPPPPPPRTPPPLPPGPPPPFNTFDPSHRRYIARRPRVKGHGVGFRLKQRSAMETGGVVTIPITYLHSFRLKGPANQRRRRPGFWEMIKRKKERSARHGGAPLRAMIRPRKT